MELPFLFSHCLCLFRLYLFLLLWDANMWQNPCGMTGGGRCLRSPLVPTDDSDKNYWVKAELLRQRRDSEKGQVYSIKITSN